MNLLTDIICNKENGDENDSILKIRHIVTSSTWYKNDLLIFDIQCIIVTPEITGQIVKMLDILGR